MMETEAATGLCSCSHEIIRFGTDDGNDEGGGKENGGPGG